jgi:hypothetical protein
VFARGPGGQGFFKGLGRAAGFVCFHARASWLIARAQIQPHEHALGIGQVANDFSYGLRQLAHQRGNGKDLVAFGKLGLLHQINDIDAAESILEHKTVLGSYHHSIFYIQKYIDINAQLLKILREEYHLE